MYDGDAELTHVRGLRVPDLLLDLVRAGAWHHPGDAALAQLMPWFADQLDFLVGVQAMARESRSLDHLVEDDTTAQVFRLARSSNATSPVQLPCLDVDQAFIIAIARHAGDDTAVALDYRAGASNPRVVASDIWSEPRRHVWRVVAETFPAFTVAAGMSVNR